MTGVSGKRALLALTWVVGAVGGAAASLGLFMAHSPCPQWEDEGRMAAPHSPYGLIMCSPQTQEPPFVVVVGLAALVALAALIWWFARTPRGWPRAGGAAFALLLGPALLVGILHLTLPQGCLGGTASSGSCSRDREQRG